MLSEEELTDKLHVLANKCCKCLIPFDANVTIEDMLADLEVFIQYRMFDCEATHREKEYLEKLLQEKK